MTRLAPWLGSLFVHGTLVGAASQCRQEQAVDVVDAEVAEIIEVQDERVVSTPAVPATTEVGEVRDVREASAPRGPARAPEEEKDAPAAAAPGPAPSTWPGLDVENGVLGGGLLGGAGTGSVGGSVGSSGGGGASGARRAVPVRRAAMRSRARPPRLVYPVRDREERPGEVFVARLTINEGGYVVGARLEQGIDPYRDRKALDAVWRFHYAPALDRRGRPVRAQILQRFMVE